MKKEQRNKNKDIVISSQSIDNTYTTGKKENTYSSGQKSRP